MVHVYEISLIFSNGNVYRYLTGSIDFLLTSFKAIIGRFIFSIITEVDHIPFLAKVSCYLTFIKRALKQTHTPLQRTVQTHTHSYTQTQTSTTTTKHYRHTARQTDTHTHTHTHTSYAENAADRPTDRHTHTFAENRTDRHTHTQTHTQTQTSTTTTKHYRHTARQTNIHAHK